MATEKRLIDANAFAECLERMTKTAYPNLFPGLLEAIDYAKDFPSVDAVEVVRCKDCKWYKEGELLAPNKFCFRLMHPTENRHICYNFCDDDFCSYGERKDNVH